MKAEVNAWRWIALVHRRGHAGDVGGNLGRICAVSVMSTAIVAGIVTILA